MDGWKGGGREGWIVLILNHTLHNFSVEQWQLLFTDTVSVRVNNKFADYATLQMDGWRVDRWMGGWISLDG